MTNQWKQDERDGAAGPVPDSAAIAQSLATPASFAGVFERHFSSVHRYIARRLGSDLADELASEVFIVAFDHRAGYDQAIADARPWLLGIATNLVRRHWRAERRWLKACERMAIGLSEVEKGSAALPAVQLDESLLSALRSLARRDREALLMLAWGELTYEEIALALGIPIGTVRSRINRARRGMGEALCSPESALAAATPLPTTTLNHQRRLR
jgi:RNA polymerase sigma factor (sigma-70 family)